MAGGVTLQVRQIGSYPALGSAGPGEYLLVQPGPVGTPYATVDAQVLVETALNVGGRLGVGTTVPGDALEGQLFTGTDIILPSDAALAWNLYFSQSQNVYVGQQGGLGGFLGFNPEGFAFVAGNAPGIDQPVAFGPRLMVLSPAGALSLSQGTLTVARDPAAALEVATMGWVGRSTVTSFNGRQGAITLNGCDVYAALCLTDTIATETWVNSQIQASIQMLLANHPFVFGWNGRTGAVYLTLADISCVFFQPGQQPITQTPPLTSNDYSIPNTAWVVEYIANEFAGGGGNLATQAWVLANTVNSFNGRVGPVTLTSSDVYDVGAAPLNSPAFSGIPTAPTAAVGQATGQIATTAFVQRAITNNTAGVSTFNTRSGDVVLETADVTGVGGLVNPSPNLLGNPTAPTQPPGTNLPVIATCEFVQAALAAGAVTSFNTRTGAVTLTLADITGVGGAPLVSPAFSSVPTAPTAAPGTNTVQLATTAFVQAAVTAAGGVSSFNSRTGAVTLQSNDISAAGGLVNPSVGLTGSPTATTATAGDNSTRIATTAFVQTALSSGAVSSFNTRTGAVTLQGADITAAGGALLASPAFTGAPTAPTAAPATNNTQIATTAYVTAAILADTTGVTSFNTRTGAISLLLADITGAGGAPLASPSFTGVPLGPTATAGTSTTQLATTAFVQAAIASSGVSSFNARTGAVTLIANDISAAGGALLAGPTFTGTPAGPTAAPGTNTTQLATTAFVAAALGSYLPLVGGTLTGPLNLPAGTSAAPALNFAGGGGLYVAAGGIGSSGAFTVGTTLGVNGTLTVTGASQFNNPVGVSGTVTATNLVSNSNTNVLGSLSVTGTASFVASGDIQINANGIVYAAPSGGSSNSFAFLASGGNLFWILNGAGQGGLQPLTSDATLKENFAPLEVDCLGVVSQIQLQQYDWKAAGRPHISCGYTAQQIETLIPEAVLAGPPGTPLGVDMMPLVAYLIGAVQELGARVSALDGKPL